MKPLKLSRFKHSFFYICIVIAFQVAILVSAIMMTGLGTDAFLVAVFFLYTPVIFAISSVDNSVGCSRMIGPIILGIPVGIGIYSVIAGCLITALKRRKLCLVSFVIARAAPFPTCRKFPLKSNQH